MDVQFAFLDGYLQEEADAEQPPFGLKLCHFIPFYYLLFASNKRSD